MGIKLTRHPEYDVTLLIFSGPLKAEQMIEQFRALDKRDRGHWLSYFDTSADLTEVDIAHLPALRHIVAAKGKELFGDPPRRRCSAIVYCSTVTEQFFKFWRNYAAAGEAHPTTPGLFSSFKAACDWLGLPEGACTTLEAEARDRDPADSGSSVGDRGGSAMAATAELDMRPRL